MVAIGYWHHIHSFRNFNLSNSMGRLEISGSPISNSGFGGSHSSLLHWNLVYHHSTSFKKGLSLSLTNWDEAGPFLIWRSRFHLNDGDHSLLMPRFLKTSVTVGLFLRNLGSTLPCPEDPGFSSIIFFIVKIACSFFWFLTCFYMN